jgi:hypothetical protein
VIWSDSLWVSDDLVAACGFLLLTGVDQSHCACK